MGIKFDAEYTPNSAAPDASYTWGSAINNTLPASTDGTPLEKAWVNDLEGLKQMLWAQGSITPSGVPDTIVASDTYNAIINIIARELGAKGIRSFATVALMVAATDLNVGDLIITEGYLAAGTGEALYRVVAAATGTADGGEFINLDTHQAQLIPGPVVRSSQYGAAGDGATDDSTEIQALVDAFKRIDIDTNSKITTQINFGVVGVWEVIISDVIVLGAITKGFEIGGTNCAFDFIGNGAITGDGVTAAQIGIDVLAAGALVEITAPVISACLDIGIKIAGTASVVNNPQISGAVNTAGIYIKGSAITGVKINNPICTGCADGVLIEGADYTRIENPDCTTNTASGIRLQPSATGAGDAPKYTTIVAARCNDNTGASGAGIFVSEDCNFTEILHPVCDGNTGDGIAIIGIASFEGEHVKVDSAVCDGNTKSGIRSERTKNLEVVQASLINNTIDGIFDMDSIDVKIKGGTLDGNTANGLRQQSSVRATHDGVSVANNGGRGMFLNDGGSLTPETTRTRNCDFQNNTGVDWDVSGLTDAKAFHCTGDFVTQNGGSATTIAASSVIVAHGLDGLPDYINLMVIDTGVPSTANRMVVSVITSTLFTAYVLDESGNPTVVTQPFYWKAELFV